jgi:hypothetical protein
MKDNPYEGVHDWFEAFEATHTGEILEQCIDLLEVHYGPLADELVNWAYTAGYNAGRADQAMADTYENTKGTIAF